MNPITRARLAREGLVSRHLVGAAPLSVIPAEWGDFTTTSKAEIATAGLAAAAVSHVVFGLSFVPSVLIGGAVVGGILYALGSASTAVAAGLSGAAS